MTTELHRILGPEELTLAVNPLGSTPEMQRWARDATTAGSNDLEKAKILYGVLVSHVAWRPVQTSRYRTAQEVFDGWDTPGHSFLCQEFAHLFVALGRAVGLKTYIVFVEQDCYGAQNLHACAAAFFQGQALLVDPAYSMFGAPHRKFKVLNDLEAMAVYLSGMEPLAPRVAASKLAPGLTVVEVSLFDKLASEGRWGDAEDQLAVMVRLNSESPMTLYARATMDAQAGLQDEAIDLVRKAIQAAPQTPQFHALLGYLCSAQGKLVEARDCYLAAGQYAMDERSAEFSEQAAGAIGARLRRIRLYRKVPIFAAVASVVCFCAYKLVRRRMQRL